jgi:hypothetical protein
VTVSRTITVSRAVIRMSEVRELRLRYTVGGMAELIDVLDKTNLGLLPPELALFLVHASNAANWHEVEE